MQQNWPRVSKNLILEAAFGLVVLQAPISCAEGTPDPIGLLSAPPSKGGKELQTLPETESSHNTPSFDPKIESKDTYTVNFTNISIIEYIRFVSRITGQNFVFDDGELQFNVTIVSEDPITPANIMSILIQVLRIHDLIVLEQDNNLLITKSKNVNQIATIVSSDTPEDQGMSAPVVTRVFRIRNASLNSIASIIRPMLSDSALLEMSAETKQLIITDITTNVDKISTLLASIDTPHSSLEIDSYSVRNLDPQELIAFAHEILSPFSEGNPLLFVPQPSTRTIFIVSTPHLIERALALMEDLDVPGSAPKGTSMRNMFMYSIQHVTGPKLLQSLETVGDELKARKGSEALVECLQEAQWIKESNSILFVSDPNTLEAVKEILPTLDSLNAATGFSSKSNFLVYKIENATEEQMKESLDQMADNLEDASSPDEPLIDAIHSLHYIKETNSLIFTGSKEALGKLSSVLPTFDVSSGVKSAESQFLVYKIQQAPVDELDSSLDQMAANLAKAPVPDKALIQAIKSKRYMKETNSLVFTGNENSLKRLSEVLPTFDTPSSETALAKSLSANQFMVYHPKFRSGEELQKSLRDISANLRDSGLADPAFMQTIDSMRWVSTTNSLIFTGNDASLKQIDGLLSSIDTARESHGKGEVFLYKPKYVSKTQLQDALKQLAKNLDDNNPSDAQLQDAIDSAKWIEDSQSFLFRSDPPTIQRIKELLKDLDTLEGFTGGGAHTFYLYKLQHAPCEAVIENLNRVASNLEASGIPNPALFETLSSAKCLKDNNSILLTGSAGALEQAKKIVEQFDNPTSLSSSAGKSSFFIYQPVHQTATLIRDRLNDLGKDLQASGLIDPDLLQTIQTARYAESTNSIVFTGSPISLEKVKDLVNKIDVLSSEEAQIQHLGDLTFLIYKIQYVPAAQLVSSLKGLSLDLQKTGAIDEHVVTAVNGMKWIKETNSILFVGSPETLQKVELMIRKFDIPALAPRAEAPPPGTFVVYTPKYVPGDELIKIIEEFEQNLISSGIGDHALFDTINNLKWIPRTCSLLIPGDAVSISKVEDLLRRFDVPSRDPKTSAPSIESIENVSFLIYKLQYHQGNEITTALKQITVDIAKGGSSTNQALVSAINSLQWIRVTNSLLASGEPETLGKLKDLIQNLDIPLRQIFIEVLVIETSVTNTHNFGLQWGGRMQYLNRFGAASGNFPLSSANSTPSTNNSTLGTGIANGIVNGTTVTTPSNANVPFLNGFDLGVIGDIIMHKGQSFLSLGSLVNALQTDTDSTIVLNPKIITQDNRTSTIFVGNNIPFTGSLVTTQSSLVQSSQNLEYRDIGFNLSITPTIGNNDVVTLDINNDISEVLQNPIAGTSSATTTITGIQTSHTTMSTRVHVPDRHFVVLSGMVQDSKSRFKSQIPCLGGLPVIGAAFSESDRVNSKQNVIIFVRPHIVNTHEEYKTITDDQETLFKNQAVLPVLKEEFDAGIDMVKTPENE